MGLIDAINFNGSIVWVIFLNVATLLLGVNKGFLHGVSRGCFELALAYMMGRIAAAQAMTPPRYFTSGKSFDLLIVTTLCFVIVAIIFKLMGKLFPKLVGKDLNMPVYYLGYFLGVAIMALGADFVG